MAPPVAYKPIQPYSSAVQNASTGSTDKQNLVNYLMLYGELIIRNQLCNSTQTTQLYQVPPGYVLFLCEATLSLSKREDGTGLLTGYMFLDFNGNDTILYGILGDGVDANMFLSLNPALPLRIAESRPIYVTAVEGTGVDGNVHAHFSGYLISASMLNSLQ